MRASYLWSLYFVALGSIILGTYTLGFGGYDFIVVVGVAVLPIWILMIFVSIRLFPLELEESTASETELRYFLADRGSARRAFRPVYRSIGTLSNWIASIIRRRQRRGAT